MLPESMFLLSLRHRKCEILREAPPCSLIELKARMKRMKNAENIFEEFNENLLTGVNRQIKLARLGYYHVKTQGRTAPSRALRGVLKWNT